MSSASREIVLPCPWGSVRGLEWGDPTRPHILAVHGWLDNCKSFHFLGPALADAGYHVVAVDLPGHGHSDPLPAGLHYHDLEFVSLLHRLVRRMGWDKGRYSLVGHSLGAGICLVYTAAFPDQVQLLVMLDMTFLIPRPGTPLDFQPRLRASVLGEIKLEDKMKETPVKLYQTKEEAVQRLLQPPVYMRNKKIQQTITESSARILLDRGLKEMEGGFGFTRDLRMSVPSMDNISWEDQLQLTQEISCPHLIVEATDGPKNEFFRTMQEEFSKQNPQFRHLVVPGLHHVHLNKPEEVNRIVVSFIQEFGKNSSKL